MHKVLLDFRMSRALMIHWIKLTLLCLIHLGNRSCDCLLGIKWLLLLFKLLEKSCLVKFWKLSAFWFFLEFIQILLKLFQCQDWLSNLWTWDSFKTDWIICILALSLNCRWFFGCHRIGRVRFSVIKKLLVKNRLLFLALVLVMTAVNLAFIFCKFF